MKASELRIGNWIQKNYEPYYDKDDYNNIQITLTELSGVIIFKDIDNKRTHKVYKPIPLTEEWLVKFGFIRHPWGLVIDGLLFKDNLKCTELTFEVGNGFRTEIKHVHQLQNLYFALTGTEL